MSAGKYSNPLVMKDNKPTYNDLVNKIKHLEEELRISIKERDSEIQQKALIDNAVFPITITTIDGKARYLNHAAFNFFNLSEEIDLTNIEPSDFWVNPEKRKVFVSQIIENGSAVDFENEYITSDKKLKIALLSSSVINYQGEKVIFSVYNDITERKQLEVVFQDIIDKNPMSIQIVDINGFTIQTNAAHIQLFGAKTPAGYSIFEDTQLLEQGLGELFEQIKKGKVVHFPDSYFNSHDVNSSFPDVLKWIKTVGFALNDNNGMPKRIVLMQENITDRKHAESLFLDIVDKNPMSIQIIDKEGFTLKTNPAYTLLFGSVPPSDFSIFTELKTKGFEELISHAKNGEVVQFPDINFNAHDIYSELPDKPVVVKVVLFPLKDSTGNPERFVFMHEDITNRRQAEAELIKAKEKAEESEIKYKQIFDNTFDIMSIYEVTEDHRYKVITFNPAEAKLIGNVENYQNLYIDECIPPELYNQFKSNYERCIKEEKLIEYEEDISFQQINKTFHTQLIPLKNSSGRIHRIIVISRDITDIKLLNSRLTNQNEELILLNNDLKISKEKAEESDRLKTAFLHNISHEIRTPMNSIVGFSDLLNNPSLLPEKRQLFINTIKKSSYQLLSIINDIIKIATLESGHERIYKNEVDLNAALRLLHQQFLLNVNTQNINFTLKPLKADDEVRIITDETKLVQVLTNLISNALKFTAKGSVNFGYNQKANELEFYVEDTGMGISPELHKAIFDRFRQAEGIAQQFGGSGLGLSISKGYVELMGGRMWMNSELGKGSSFYFTIPFIKVHETDFNDSLSSNLQVSVNKVNLTILVAEDEDSNFELIEEILSGLNITTIRAVNGLEAVNICKSGKDIDLVLMDLKMPLMNGFEATSQIKSFRPKLPVIAQTAYSMDEDRNKALAYGCNDFISKPIMKELLFSKIKEQLNRI